LLTSSACWPWSAALGALSGLGLIRMARGEHRAALAAYRRALAVNPFLKERRELVPALEKKVGDKPI
jgi:hypothetical protein